MTADENARAVERLRAELEAAEEEVRRLARALAQLTAVNRDPHRFFENWP